MGEQNTNYSVDDIPKNSRTRKIQVLAQQILYHQNLYYNATPEISDAEFDSMWDRLRTLDNSHPLFSSIGMDTDNAFKKSNHIMPMGSLEKVTNESQCVQWINTHPAEYYVVQHKLDGASIELQYIEGNLTAAVTRGNGIKGDNIITNVGRMQGIVHTLSQSLDIAIRGEIIMRHDIRKQYFPQTANCRNAANGLMKRKDGKKVEYLDIICYDIWFEHDDLPYTEIEKLELLHTLGFKVVPYTVLHTSDEIHAYRMRIHQERGLLGYDIDGLVIKIPSISKNELHSLRPNGQIAYKFPLEMAQSTILDIEWSESGHIYTPVAILSPVALAGTTVKRASLVHFNHIQDLGAGIGAEVLVVKRGEIIPKIEKVVSPSSIPIEFPKTCATCGSTTINEGTRIYCPNVLCRRRIFFRVSRWCNMLELDFWGEMLLQRLVLEEKMISTIGDLYRISVQDLIALDRIGTPLANKLLSVLHNHTMVSFPVFLAGLGIDGVAIMTAEKIVEAGYANWDTLKTISVQVLESIPDIGPKIAQNIKDAIVLLEDEIEDILQYIDISQKSIINSHRVSGKSFCFTGSLSISRKEAQEKVKSYGGVVKTSIVKDLDYLVTDNINSQSSKSTQAREQGVAILSEVEFLDLLS